MKKISIIVAVDENWVIGKKNALPWRLSADLKHFRTLTRRHTVIMGRKTYESIGRPLPDRTNIIISRNNTLTIPGCTVVKTTEEALNTVPDDEEIFVVGGAEIYSQFLPITQKIYLTQIHHQFDGDIFFPKLNLSEWTETERQSLEADDKNPYKYSFITLEKTRN